MTINDVEFFMKIERVQVNPNNGIKENVVHRVSWQLWGKYVDPVTKQEHLTSIDDVTTLKFVDAAGYIPFENLTESQIIGWVEARENQRTRNMDWRKQKVLALLQEKVNPTNITITDDQLPWVQK
jgi:hypothetical protein